MAIVEKTVTLKLFKCNACGHEWKRRNKRAKGKPRICPVCKSPKWNLETQRFERLMVESSRPSLNQ